MQIWLKFVLSINSKTGDPATVRLTDEEHVAIKLFLPFFNIQSSRVYGETYFMDKLPSWFINICQTYSSFGETNLVLK